MSQAQDNAFETPSNEQIETTQRVECEGKLLQDIVIALEQMGHKMVILHGYTNFPHRVSSDVDAISLNPAQIPYALSKHYLTKSVTMVQVMQHETTAFSYFFYRSCEERPVFLALDVSSDYRRDGRIFFKGEAFLDSCQHFRFFKVPSPDLEFAYYLVKKIAKGSLGEAQAQRLSQLYGEDPTRSERQLTRFFPREETELIAEAARSEDWEPVRAHLEDLRVTMVSTLGREHPLKVFQYWLGDLRRRAKRILQPTGLMVAFLGADGSGKSTIIDRVEQNLAPIFRRTASYHLRPQITFRRAATGPVTDPHAKPPRGKAASLAKLGLWSIDYTLGYLARVFPESVRSTLILFDRYYHDLLVDTKRYRYGAWLWPARLVGRFVPHPHLFIVLDAPPEVFYARKSEVSLEEASRQREEYLKLARSLPNGHVVDASKPLDAVVTEVERIILNYMGRRTARRLGLSTEG